MKNDVHLPPASLNMQKQQTRVLRHTNTVQQKAQQLSITGKY